ncbi:FAD-dependent oxidoreductase [Chloroflexota bacterium]
MTNNAFTYVNEDRKKIVIIGGVAGGASCATRARRLSEKAEIIIFERGHDISFANCGLPYYISDVIDDEDELIIATPASFKDIFNIEVRTESEVIDIDKERREIQVKDLRTTSTYRERYDALILAPGATPIRPILPGIDLPGVFSLRTIPDSHAIRNWIEQREAKSAVIVGGSFIGLEMAENLTIRGLKVTVIEMQPQVMPNMDPEMTPAIQTHLSTHRVALSLNNQITQFEQNKDSTLSVSTKSGEIFTTDMVFLAIGVKPETILARNAGLEIGKHGGIRVNDQMRTSNEYIWALGDAAEVNDLITSEWTLVQLAGPANRQGRIAAGAILGFDCRFRGVQATSACSIFGMTIATTGASEKTLKHLATIDKPINYEKIYLYPGHHAGFYPGAKPITFKLIFSPEDGRILGAQAIGMEGIDKRIDVIAAALQNKATVFDLEEAELCYAPQLGAAKDPVNMAGMIAANILRGDAPIAHWEDINNTNALILDVREPFEFTSGHIEGALNFPLEEIRTLMFELPHDREIWLYCKVGKQSYYATRILRQNGFNARNLFGGLQTYNNMKRFIPV